jgi:hypothetical protein
MIPSGRSLIKPLAWCNVALHIIALALTWFFIRPGMSALDVSSRQAYVVGHFWEWATAWGTWMACAIVQIFFYAELARYLTKARDAASFAVSIACAGLAIDLLCDTIWIVLVPQLPSWHADTTMVYQVVEAIAKGGGLVVANGLYSVAVLILTLCLRQQIASPITILLGYGVFVFGMVLSLAGLVNSQWLAEFSTGPTILCYCAWALLAARHVANASAAP